jgi:DNA-directed RNA polymerase I subunit RPA1
LSQNGNEYKPLCTGILDKNVFGKYGLIHAVVELHGRGLHSSTLELN